MLSHILHKVHVSSFYAATLEWNKNLNQMQQRSDLIFL